MGSLSRTQIDQILDEAQWQYETLCEEEDNRRRFRDHPFVRSCAMLVAWQRALVAVGISREHAQTLADEAARRAHLDQPVGEASQAMREFFENHRMDGFQQGADGDWTARPGPVPASRTPAGERQ